MGGVRARIMIILGLSSFAAGPTHAQQFNSDSWVCKPHGTVTTIVTYGQRNSMFMSTFSLIPKWEFTAAAYLYNDDRNASTDDGYSTSFYGKYMFYQNEAETGGWAIKAGTGLDPGILDAENRLENAFRTFWMNAPGTLPLLDNTLSWDLTPGISLSKDLASAEPGTWVFTYVTRMAWYPKGPAWSLVGEVLGAEGEGAAKPEYRVGFRWEPNPRAVFALTYDEEFRGGGGAGWEIGLMLFSPSFFCIGDCD